MVPDRNLGDSHTEKCDFPTGSFRKRFRHDVVGTTDLTNSESVVGSAVKFVVPREQAPTMVSARDLRDSLKHSETSLVIGQHEGLRGRRGGGDEGGTVAVHGMEGRGVMREMGMRM